MVNAFGINVVVMGVSKVCKCLCLWSLCSFRKYVNEMRKEAVWCGIVCFVIRQNVLSLFFMMLICLTLLTLARSVF